MINTKVKFFEGFSTLDAETKVNRFLSEIDIRQVVKIDHAYGGSSSRTYFSCMIVYFEKFSDVEDLKSEGAVGGLIY